MAAPFSLNPPVPPTGCEPLPADGAALVRLARLMVSTIDAAGSEGLRLTPNSAVLSLARALVGEATDKSGMVQTAVMALRDLVWRVDTARSLLAQRSSPSDRREIEQLFDTSDVHAFLTQCVCDGGKIKNSATKDPACG
jgi:hypothetical protein